MIFWVINDLSTFFLGLSTIMQLFWDFSCDFSSFGCMMIFSPPLLQKGSKVALVSPAKAADVEAVQSAIDLLKSWGLKVVIGKYAFARSHQFAGTDKQRAADLQRMLDDPAIGAIFCIRGGYGTTRIIDNINFDRFRQHPKWIIGYSDITALHLHIHTMGIQSIHATMPLLFGRDSQASLKSLKNVLMPGVTALDSPLISPHPLNRTGKATGQLIGGNLSLIDSCIGTASDVDMTGKILFLEDIGEYLYRLDRMMVHLKRAGKLQHLAGLVIGHFTDMVDNDIPFGKNAFEIVCDAVRAYNYPVCVGYPTGHEPENLALVCGRTYTLQVQKKKVCLNID